MGIDIYLNGYEAVEARTVQERAAFDKAVKARDRCTRDSHSHKQLQQKVEAAYDKMFTGSKGYIRSSYNGLGLFRVLEEIYGFDVGAYLFPGDWDTDQPLDGAEFVRKVQTLQATAVLAMQADKRELPWIEEFTAVSGQRAPDPNEQHVAGELLGDSVFGMLAQVSDVLTVEGGPAETKRYLSSDHHWYLTTGLKELLEFGLLAEELNKRGEATFAHISY